MKHWALAILLFAAAPASVRAETLFMKDGSLRYGTIQSYTNKELRLRIVRDGITATATILLNDIDHIEPGPAAPPTPAVTAAFAMTQPTTPGTPGTSTTTTALTGSAPPTTRAIGTGPIVSASPPAMASAVVTTRPGMGATTGGIPNSASTAGITAGAGFLPELAASALGKGLDDPMRLPPSQRALWESAVRCDAEGKRSETLEALQALEASTHELATRGMATTAPTPLARPTRLDAISLRVREEPFGQWMARTHWDLLSDKYKTGQFDLRDMREIERPGLIRILREKTEPALEPLRAYFPPIDPKTAAPAPFRPAQLQGISAGNALEIKDKALLAGAVLQAQLRLEPEMPAIDRQLLSGELATINRILSRAREFEPAARMAQYRAETERKSAEEKARRDAALQKQREGLGMK